MWEPPSDQEVILAVLTAVGIVAVVYTIVFLTWGLMAPAP